MNISFEDFSRAATLAMNNQGLSGEDSVIHLRQEGNAVQAMGRTWRPWGSSGRTADFKEANRATRQQLLDALSGELNIDFTKVKEIPKALLKALNLDKFSLDRNGQVQSHKPLTARRITLISKAVAEIKSERAMSAQASLNASAFSAAKGELNALMAQNPGRFRTISDNGVRFFSTMIADAKGKRSTVDQMTDSIVRKLTKNANVYMGSGLEQAFPALKNEDFKGLRDQVKAFVTTVVDQLPNGRSVPVPEAEHAHEFNFQAEQPAVASAPRAQPLVQPAVEPQRAVSNVTVKMNADDFFTLMRDRAEEARKRPGVVQPRFRLTQNYSTQFLTWITNFAKGRSSSGKTVKNVEELTDKVIFHMQGRNSLAGGYTDDILFPGVRKAVELVEKGTLPAEAWKDIRADVAFLIAHALDIKAE